MMNTYRIGLCKNASRTFGRKGTERQTIQARNQDEAFAEARKLLKPRSGFAVWVVAEDLNISGNRGLCQRAG